jgi:hypothetical protein
LKKRDVVNSLPVITGSQFRMIRKEMRLTQLELAKFAFYRTDRPIRKIESQKRRRVPLYLIQLLRNYSPEIFYRTIEILKSKSNKVKKEILEV